ncbi:MAG TPA: trypsin-like peptidase domain-containing protein [Micromonosporaceae bacterium]|nr:trypsin-like peptidase domain-containing protein [Micromonosporaceae bacterium]
MTQRGDLTGEPSGGPLNPGPAPSGVGWPASSPFQWYESPASYQPAGSYQPTPSQESAWWTDALRDPWRDPAAPAAIRLPGVPADPGPALEPPPEPPTPRPGLRLVFLVSLMTALLAGSLGGALGYVTAARNGISALPGQGEVPPLAKRPPESVAGVVRETMPSLVTILIHNRSQDGNGSGFVISTDGHVVTNEHVAMAGGPKADLRVVFSDGSTERAKLVGASAESDIAVLKVDRTGLTPVTFGDSDRVVVGDPVIAVGAPLGLRNTVTTGVVSAVDRPVAGGRNDPSVFAAIQTDAPINPGNSGGALLDGGGRVVGVNTAIYTVKPSDDGTGGSIGLGFAIPINQAKRVAAEIVRTGHARNPVIGAEMDTNYSTLSGGVRLAEVESGGPAAKGGLKAGDVVTKLNGQPLREPIDLVALIRKHAPGAVINMEYLRGSGRHTARITLGADE